MITKQESKSPSIRLAGPSDVEAMADTLASAFQADPVFCWLLGRAADPEQRLRPMFRSFAIAALSDGATIAHVEEGIAGAALWKEPGSWRSGVRALVRMLPGNIRTNRQRFLLALRTYTALERFHPEEPHYYLTCLGTRADRQGQGLGGTIIGQVLDRADDEGTPAYTESSNPRNVPFYVRHGFAVQREVQPVRHCPPLTLLWRDPR